METVMSYPLLVTTGISAPVALAPAPTVTTAPPVPVSSSRTDHRDPPGQSRAHLPDAGPPSLEDVAMRCPFCRHEDTRVVDSRVADEGQAIRRRRSCTECGRRFTTVESAVLAVVKRNGVTEPFSREKVMRGVRRACQGRAVDEDRLALLAQQVEDAVRASGSAEIPSNEVGLAILAPLRELDEVAYLRFASVYRSFESVEDVQREIDDLRAAGHVGAGSGGQGVDRP
jgi:transcriptional repressor NrdR